MSSEEFHATAFLFWVNVAVSSCLNSGLCGNDSSLLSDEITLCSCEISLLSCKSRLLSGEIIYLTGEKVLLSFKSSQILFALGVGSNGGLNSKLLGSFCSVNLDTTESHLGSICSATYRIIYLVGRQSQEACGNWCIFYECLNLFEDSISNCECSLRSVSSINSVRYRHIIWAESWSDDTGWILSHKDLNVR